MRRTTTLASLPLLTAADFSYLGSCRVPGMDPSNSHWCYVGDRGGLAFDQTTGHLWAHDGYGVYRGTRAYRCEARITAWRVGPAL